MGRLIKRIVILALVAIAAIFVIRAIASGAKQQTGKQWMEKQAEYVEELRQFTEEMDSVFALYISESIPTEDFLNHIDVLFAELTLLEETRAQDLENKPVKIGSHTQDTKDAVDAVDDLYWNLREILSLGYQYADNLEELSYRYIAAQQDVSANLSKYVVSVYYQNNVSEEK